MIQAVVEQLLTSSLIALAVLIVRAELGHFYIEREPLPLEEDRH